MEKNYTSGPSFLVDTNHQMNFADTTVCQLKYVGQEKEMFIGSAATNHGDIEATAKLIAAAPELLEALQEVVKISDRNHDAWNKAKAAIKKATI